MHIHRILLMVLFWILAFLNINGYIDISSREVFGLTLGALIISISTCFDSLDRWSNKKTMKPYDCFKDNKYEIIQKAIYSIGFLFMFIVIFIKPDTIVDRLMEKLDSNTLMLLSISVTFLSITISNINSNVEKNRIRKYYLDKYEDKVKSIMKKK